MVAVAMAEVVMAEALTFAKSLSTPANAGSSERRKSCSHTLSVILSGAGFFARREASSRMPPVSRKRHSVWSSLS